MNIVAPTANKKEARKLISAGANELYCGIMPAQWRNKYSNVVSPNRREVKKGNFDNWQDLAEMIAHASKQKVKVILTLNDLYAKSQYPFIIAQAKKAASLGVGGFMVADLAFLDYLLSCNLGVPVNISTGATVFNSESVAFFKQFNPEKIILPRHLSLNEIKDIVRSHPDVCFELFVLNAGCRNVDGFCTFIHGLGEFQRQQKEEMFFKTAACYLDYEVKLANPKGLDSSFPAKVKSGLGLSSGFKSCAACFLKDFKRWGISAVKIVGRDYSTEMKIKDITFIKTLLEYLDDHPKDDREFNNYAKQLFWKTYRVKCAFRCYYNW
jgi:putative protease